MSDHPTCPAATSHVVWFSIQLYPVWSVHVPEVTTEYTVICRPGIVLHALLEASQCNPVVLASQSAVPQAQAPELGAVPFVTEQEGSLLHRLKAASQNNPVVLALQSVVPQTHAPAFAAVPSPWGQAGPVKAHRQALDSGE